MSLYSKEDPEAKIITFIFAILLLFFILYPFWSYTFPPPEKEGILVAFGQLEIVGAEDIKENAPKKIENEKTVEEKPEEEKKVEKPKEPQKASSDAAKPKIIANKESPVVAKKEAVAKGPTAEEIRKQQEAEQQRQEAERQAEYEKTKQQFGDLFSKGKGNSDRTGDAGDPKGDPNAEVLKSIVKGKAKIEGGLSDRGLVKEPKIDENSQKAGIVVVRVCVNNNGEVIEANYTQRGSTTTDSDLVKAAIEGAKGYRFSKSPIEKQCGTITIEFKLK